MSFYVNSEVGRLRQVMVHRPGLELARLTPHNIADLLFDDVMWADRAREEHDAFADQLRARERIEVVPVVGSELGRGRGGPRYMTCQIERESVS